MHYIVFDLEFNMFFKFREGDLVNPELKSEIIQVGAVKLSENLEALNRFSVVVKPVIYPRMNPYVRKKTNISPAQIGKGIPFRKAMEDFSSWVGKDAILCSWGHDDMLGLRDNCRFFDFQPLSFDKFINIQQIYMKRKGLYNQPSLESSVEDLGIPVRTPFHDALSDAIYTADVFRQVYDFSEDIIVDWEKVQRENEKMIADLKGFLGQEEIQCPECNLVLAKEKEVRKAKKYFAFGYCSACKRHVRNVSRIVNRDGVYSLVVHNYIYDPPEEIQAKEGYCPGRITTSPKK